jgi:hypothetical protein
MVNKWLLVRSPLAWGTLAVAIPPEQAQDRSRHADACSGGYRCHARRSLVLRCTFDAGVLRRLALIALARSVGFSLDETGALFGPDGQPRLDRVMLAAKADELDAAIRKLSTTSPAPSDLECPNLQRRLEAAATEARQRRRDDQRSEALDEFRHRLDRSPAVPPCRCDFPSVRPDGCRRASCQAGLPSGSGLRSAGRLLAASAEWDCADIKRPNW